MMFSAELLELLLTFIFANFCIVLSAGGGGDAETSSPVEIYRNLFRLKRGEQLAAVKSILNMGDYQKQHKFVDRLLGTMENTIKTAKSSVESSGFSPGDDFPSAEEAVLKDALSQILENAALFADLALRLPEITGVLYRTRRDFHVLINWCIGFSNTTGFYDAVTTKLMHLAGQQLGLVERDPDFQNPYVQRKKSKDDPDYGFRHDTSKDHEMKKTPKKTFQKGPKLSGSSRINEL